MPFDLWITRASSFDAAENAPEAAPAAKLGLLGRMLGGGAPPPITEDLFRKIFGGFTSRARDDGSCWVYDPNTDDPWLAGSWRPGGSGAGGHIALSASYTNPRYP